MCVVAPLFGIALLSFEMQKDYMYVIRISMFVGCLFWCWPFLGLIFSCSLGTNPVFFFPLITRHMQKKDQVRDVGLERDRGQEEEKERSQLYIKCCGGRVGGRRDFCLTVVVVKVW